MADSMENELKVLTFFEMSALQMFLIDIWSAIEKK